MELINIVCAFIFMGLPYIHTKPYDVVLNFYGTQNMNLDTNVGNQPPPIGYERFGDNYYKYHRDPKNIIQAMRVCEAEGAHISIINSEEEAAYMMIMMNRFPSSALHNVKHKDYILMGFNDALIEGQYLTMDGKALESSGYFTWAPNEPNGGDGERCGSFHRSGGLNDVPCSITLPYICEFNPAKNFRLMSSESNGTVNALLNFNVVDGQVSTTTSEPPTTIPQLDVRFGN